MGTCGCGAVWSGYRTAHCAATGCHRTFSGVSGFDQHRPGQCLDPASLGMAVIRRSGNTEVWGVPMDAQARERIRHLHGKPTEDGVDNSE